MKKLIVLIFCIWVPLGLSPSKHRPGSSPSNPILVAPLVVAVDGTGKHRVLRRFRAWTAAPPRKSLKTRCHRGRRRPSTHCATCNRRRLAAASCDTGSWRSLAAPRHTTPVGGGAAPHPTAPPAAGGGRSRLAATPAAGCAGPQPAAPPAGGGAVPHPAAPLAADD